MVGAAFLAAPEGTGALVGVSLPSVTARNDVRAVYGGLQLGCATFLGLCAARRQWLVPGLAAQLLTLGGLFAARLVSLAADGVPTILGFALQGAELVGLAAGALALRSARTEPF